MDPQSGGEAFSAALLREVAEGHVLYVANFVVVARRVANDDVWIAVADLDGCAVVHLTWRLAPELPPYPRTTWFDTVQEAKTANEAR